MNEPGTAPSPSVSPRWGRRLAYALGVVAAGALLFALSDLVQLFVVAALVAYLLDPLTKMLERRGWSRTQATAGIFLGLVAVLALAGALLLPLALDQARGLRDGLNLDALDLALVEVEGWMGRNLGVLGLDAFDLTGEVRTWAQGYAEGAVGYVPSLLSVLGDMALLPFIVFFLLKDGRTMRKRVIGAVPNTYFEFSLTVIRKMNAQVGAYLRGQLLCAAVVAALSIAALWALGVPYPILIGVVAGVTNIIPYLGPVIGGTLAIAVTVVATGSFALVPWIVLAFVLIQLVDNVAVQPLVLSHSAELHPLTVLVALLVAGQFFGILGLLVAVPVAAMGRVLIREIAVNLRRYKLT